MHLFLNTLASSAGAGLTYIRNVIPQLSARDDIRTTIALPPQMRHEFQGLDRISFVECGASGVMQRFWLEQTALPVLIRKSGADLLISTGNFALRRSPVPQILLSGNSLYTSHDFYRDLRTRREYGLWLDTRLKGYFAKRSVSWADITVTPSRAFAEQLRSWAKGQITCIYHGFDHQEFFRNQSPLTVEIQQQLASAGGHLKLLYVSHYNYYRNFETLLNALPLLRHRLAPRKFKLFLTCKFRSEENPGSYRADSAADLVKRLDLREEVVELGAIPYSQLHHLYRACDLYVTPAYTETFAHPLVEAMASNLPVVASNLQVHREICGPAAVYFETFSPPDLAEKIATVVSAETSRTLADAGKKRSQDFSWKTHVEQLVQLASQTADARQKGEETASRS